MTIQRKKISFSNSDGQQLAALMEFPEGSPQAFALFAHCFTCGKDNAAASRISRSLAGKGIAVMRFDFTGLGNSDGDFANTNFSSNVGDLVAAAAHLRQFYAAPALLIGHSLGGAAVLAAANSVPEAVAVVTIAAPSNPSHVQKQFGVDVELIRKDGVAEVSLAGRPFRIQKQFLDDIENQKLLEHVATLRKALLVFHSPIDTMVSIDEAATIYQAAKHPKSFISLHQADHLLTNRLDAEYVGNTIASWATRYMNLTAAAEPAISKLTSGEIRIKEGNKSFLREVFSDDHRWIADEPIKVGGSNLGPDPYELLLAALGTCTSMTVRMYANRKQWPLEDIDVQLSHNREHRQDSENCDTDQCLIDVLKRSIFLKGDLSAAQRQKLLEIADKCPVHKTLENTIEIQTQLVE
ncbi:MAG: putative OsmC-like protein/alpha/beta superfamily hydrolase [Halieaceae bacterium]|jgi:uncharacterized OsmC-like protein/alpha/beta superfamily hydrolase